MLLERIRYGKTARRFFVSLQSSYCGRTIVWTSRPRWAGSRSLRTLDARLEANVVLPGVLLRVQSAEPMSSSVSPVFTFPEREFVSGSILVGVLEPFANCTDDRGKSGAGTSCDGEGGPATICEVGCPGSGGDTWGRCVQSITQARTNTENPTVRRLPSLEALGRSLKQALIHFHNFLIHSGIHDLLIPPTSHLESLRCQHFPHPPCSGGRLGRHLPVGGKIRFRKARRSVPRNNLHQAARGV